MKNNDLKLLVADIDGTLVNEPREMMQDRSIHTGD